MRSPVIPNLISFVFSRRCQAIGSVYSGLQTLSERSSMVSRALDYIGDIMKHVKPSLVSKNQDGLQLVYWAVGEEPRRHTLARCSKIYLFIYFFLNITNPVL